MRAYHGVVVERVSTEEVSVTVGSAVYCFSPTVAELFEFAARTLICDCRRKAQTQRIVTYVQCPSSRTNYTLPATHELLSIRALFLLHFATAVDALSLLVMVLERLLLLSVLRLLLLLAMTTSADTSGTTIITRGVET